MAYAAVPFVTKKDEEKAKEPVRPSELPIYSPTVERYALNNKTKKTVLTFKIVNTVSKMKNQIFLCSKRVQPEDSYGPLEEMVGTVRRELTGYLDVIEIHKHKAWQMLQEKLNNSEGEARHSSQGSSCKLSFLNLDIWCF